MDMKSRTQYLWVIEEELPSANKKGAPCCPASRFYTLFSPLFDIEPIILEIIQKIL